MPDELWDEKDGMIWEGKWYPWSMWFVGYKPGDYRNHDYNAQFWRENQEMGGWSEAEYRKSVNG